MAAGLKPSGGLDLGLLVADAPRSAAAVFTRNRLAAAPVVLGRWALRARAEVRSLVVNAGVANALTGEQGLRAARAMAARTEERCGGPAFVMSTGVIGVQLPLERTLLGIDAAARRLARSEAAAAAVAEAILTTDTRPKQAAVALDLPDLGLVTVGGLAKGSGMIHPDMATMLAVVVTDAPILAPALEGLLRRAVDRSFHEITVDGDTSTNDTVLLLAGGRDGVPIHEADPRLVPLEEAITAVMRCLAWQVVHDGEGVSRVLELRVTGARDRADARRVAVAIGRSPLVRTALAGGDPNWGRILAAAANAGVPLDAERLTLTLGGTPVFAEGLPLPVDEAAVDAAFAHHDVAAQLDLGCGPASARLLVADLTKEYVRINADYTT